MAVWMQIIGLRKLDSLSAEKNRFSKILSELETDFDFISDWNLHQPYNSKNWKLKKHNAFEYFQYSFKSDSEIDNLDMDSIRIFIENPDFISFYAPQYYFYNWWDFINGRGKIATEGWRNFFGLIASKYGLKELIYSSEAGFSTDAIYEGDETFETYYKYWKSHPEFRKNDLYDISKQSEHFIEKINPVANNTYN
ncbi:hypothetical protein [Maribacter sp. 2307UL18-2]|uniref:hypothetical protein n=1 Tax=Maribacter sp. 2307UL18-2 TaxID=3386274 RepID=UPI0039BC74A2